MKLSSRTSARTRSSLSLVRIATSPLAALRTMSAGIGAFSMLKVRPERASTRPVPSNTIASLSERFSICSWSVRPEPLGIAEQQGAVAVDRRRDHQYVGADGLLMLVQIGLGDRGRVADRGADALVEPTLQPAI